MESPELTENFKRLMVEISRMIAHDFTGSVTINFHKGNPSKKYEVKEFKTV